MDCRRVRAAGSACPVPAKAEGQRLYCPGCGGYRVGAGLGHAAPQADALNERCQNSTIHDRAGQTGFT